MAQRKRQTKTKTKRKTKKEIQQQEKMMLVLIGFAFILFAAFGFFQLGFLGTLIANCLRMIGGNSYRILSLALMGYGGWVMVKTTEAKLTNYRRLLGAGLMYAGILLFMHARLFRGLQSIEPNILHTTWETLLGDIRNNQILANVGGGLIGAFLYQCTYFLVAQVGSYLVAILLGLLGAFFFSMKSGHEIVDLLQTLGENLQQLLAGDEQKRIDKEKRRQAKKQAKEAEIAAKKAAIIAEMQEQRAPQKAKPTEPSVAEVASQPIVEKPEIVPIEGFQKNTAPATNPTPAALTPSAVPEVEDDGADLEFEIAAEAENRDYELPSAELLDSLPPTDQSDEYSKIERNIEVLEACFNSFGVDAKVVKASLGPAVTKFEIQPAVGVKVSKIVSLTDDIALALAAKDLRMEAPIPGKSLIGIEVPNSTVSMVSFREVVEAQPDHPDKLLEVPLGRDISGLVQTADLTKMPHLLVAGSTGSGKSVAINGVITSILMRAKPHEVKMMMIDPKMVELNVYNGIPHLLTPVVTNPRKAAQALQKVVKEMEERYEKFAATGVRNITGYNEFIRKKTFEDGEIRPILPFIVVIVDELADLMMVASNEVEDAIIRLAQMARAAGIHMILATQRPSVDVITGIIKANVPSRIAFAVSSGIDSRTIIDGNGAEKLLGRGDMLYLPMGENKPIRVQGAFISDHEVERVVEFVTDQQEARYEEKMMVTEETSSEAEQPQDELYNQAKDLVIEMQTASVSLLQRRFRVGYNRAARLVDELEAHGVVGPSEGSKPRKVLLEASDVMNEAPTPTDEFM
ncbi:MAG: DNA translocase FtsK [Enterococcus sp.]